MGKIIRKLSEIDDVKRNKEHILDMVKSDWCSYVYATIEESKDPEILVAAIEGQPKNAHVNIFNRDKEYTFSSAVLGDDNVPNEDVYSPIRWASKSLQNNKEIALAAVKKNWVAIKYVSKQLQNDYDVVMAAIESQEPVDLVTGKKANMFGTSLFYVSTYSYSPLAWASKLQNNREVVLAAVKKNGMALGYAAPKLRNDPEILAAAINAQEQGQVFKKPKDSTSLRGVFDSSLDDQIKSEIYNHIYSPLAWASKFKNNREFVLAAVKKNGMALGYVSADLRNDPQVVFEAVKEDGRAFEFASKELRGNRKIAYEAVKTYGDVVELVSPELRNDRSLIGLKELLFVTSNFPFDGKDFNRAVKNLNLEDDLVYQTAKDLIINRRILVLKKVMKRRNLKSTEELPKEDVDRMEQLINDNLIAIEKQRTEQMQQNKENQKGNFEI